MFTEHDLKGKESFACPIERARKNAIHFLECECSVKYGFLTETKSNSVFKIPSSYESALLLPYIMNEGVDNSVLDKIVSILKENRRSSGFWNFFFTSEQQSHAIIPDDINNTALPAVALFLTGNFRIDQCRELAREIIRHRLVDPKTNAIKT